VLVWHFGEGYVSWSHQDQDCCGRALQRAKGAAGTP